MAHELDMSNSRVNMAYTGSVPWHGLGQALTHDAPLEVWRKEAGMDWELRSSPLLFQDDKAEVRKFKARNVLYRSDTSAGLGVVSEDYKIVQPATVMEFFRDLIDGQGYTMETAGCLFGGRKFWALARVGKSVKLMDEDVVSPYLLMATSCDGSMATAVHLTSVRVVCNNTLRMSIGSDAGKAKIRVNHSATFDPAIVKAQLGIVGGAWESFIGKIELLAQFKLDRDQAIQIVADEIKKEWTDAAGNSMGPESMLEASAVLRRIIRLYDGDALGANYRSARGTAWGLVNAVTQYFDHETAGTGDKSRAFERAQLTDRAKFKTNIADSLLALID